MNTNKIKRGNTWIELPSFTSLSNFIEKYNVETENKEKRLWFSASKKKLIPIKNMDEVYILNCIKVLQGKGKSIISLSLQKNRDKFIKWFEEELKSRK